MIINNQEVDISIIYKKIRHIYFRFPCTNSLVITAPKNTSEKQIMEIIKKNQQSLAKLHLKNMKKSDYDSKFYYLGKIYTICFDINISNPYFEDDILYVASKVILDKFIKKETMRIFNDEVARVNEIINDIPPFKLKVRKMKTRWGVCNRRLNTITLNSELIKKDLHLLTYVIVHEMCHFYEPNHSKQFWSRVSQYYPNYKMARRELNDI